MKYPSFKNCLHLQKKDCKKKAMYQGFKCSHIKVTPSFLREKARKVTPLLEYGGWRSRGANAPLAVLALVAQPLPRAKAPTLIRCGLNAHLRRFFLRTVPPFTRSFSHSFQNIFLLSSLFMLLWESLDQLVQEIFQIQ